MTERDESRSYGLMPCRALTVFEQVAFEWSHGADEAVERVRPDRAQQSSGAGDQLPDEKARKKLKDLAFGSRRPVSLGGLRHHDSCVLVLGLVLSSVLSLQLGNLLTPGLGVPSGMRSNFLAVVGRLRWVEDMDKLKAARRPWFTNGSHRDG
ncbi:predicted protein [Verticillium alfalfae VaMs.102]|uniref:Predicted protein n=1 Tax=Verticillium alfalfae (strain VaMs.102 / ATCC MYA-4576 / FGSC 10136) TaxID=526221 RepID=C9SY80_VERA1|nr:predicted protein [Verticillium alfalfae VaMs.102]EEY23745.1 predicted protein [Verticillium alfalfae VaMs.102]